MHTHIRALSQAAAQLQISHKLLDQAGNLLRLEHGGQRLLFQSNHTPFNDEAQGWICLDKGYTYDILREVVAMPRSLTILDFAVPERYREYLQLQTPEDAVAAIEASFAYPLVVKRNRGALASNVFLCRERVEVFSALTTIFDRRSHRFDFAALAQEFLPAAREYRVVCFRGEVVFAYERVIDGEDFKAAYWTRPGGEPRLIEDADALASFQRWAAPIFAELPLGFVGLDVLETHDGRWVLLELNSAPRFDHIAEVAGIEPVVAMYRRVLGRYFQMPL